MAPTPLRSIDLAMLLLARGKKPEHTANSGNLPHLSHLQSRRVLRLAGDDEDAPSRGLSLPGLSDILTDGGLPRGVVELSAPGLLGGATSFALAAVRAAQARASTAWCAWIDPEGTLHAPGIVAAGVDPLRMLVVRPARSQLAHVTVKVVSSGAFEVVVVDFDAIAGTILAIRPSRSAVRSTKSPELLVRKLALAAEPHGTTVLLLSDSNRPRAAVWPVALGLELSRPNRHDLSVRIAKDRRGRVGLAKRVPFRPIARFG
jgi:hypothetical protein